MISSIFLNENIEVWIINLNFITDKDIKRINKNYLNHNYVTDTITFAYEKDGKKIEGEMFISLDRIKENSKLYDTAYLNECKRVIIHGCLHLTGYSDKNEMQIKKMRLKENFYLAL